MARGDWVGVRSHVLLFLTSPAEPMENRACQKECPDGQRSKRAKDGEEKGAEPPRVVCLRKPESKTCTTCKPRARCASMLRLHEKQRQNEINLKEKPWRSRRQSPYLAASCSTKPIWLRVQGPLAPSANPRFNSKAGNQHAPPSIGAQTVHRWRQDVCGNSFRLLRDNPGRRSGFSRKSST